MEFGVLVKGNLGLKGVRGCTRARKGIQRLLRLRRRREEKWNREGKRERKKREGKRWIENDEHELGEREMVEASEI